MARGWESKHVEAQQEGALDRHAAPGVREPAALDERRGTELALADLRARLNAARTPAQRDGIQQAIAALEARLSRPRDR